jgi:hypothetical protein
LTEAKNGSSIMGLRSGRYLIFPPRPFAVANRLTAGNCRIEIIMVRYLEFQPPNGDFAFSIVALKLNRPNI